MRNTGNRTREAREEKGKKGKKDKSFAAAKLLFSRGVSDGKKNPCKRLAGGGHGGEFSERYFRLISWGFSGLSLLASILSFLGSHI